MTENNYFPYLCHEDAVNEYNSLRNELIESQKQRTSLLNYSLVLIGALFGYLIADKEFSSSDAFFLIVLTIAPSLFSYSTRCRERRIAHYLKIFLKRLTPWSTLSSNNPSLGFLQRSSTTIIVLILLLDIVFLGLSWPFPSPWSVTFDLKSLSKDQTLWIFAFFVLALNGFIARRTAHLPTYEADFIKEFEKFKKEQTSAEHL